MHKKRWVMIPNDGVANSAAEQITYSETGAWQLPVGTVFVKHFARPDNNAPWKHACWSTARMAGAG